MRTRGAGARQTGHERIRIDRIVVDKQNTFALRAQPLHHGGERRGLLLIGGDPAHSNAERYKIGAQAGVRLRPDPPRQPVIAAMPFRIRRRER
jgi:hypothetical protein